MEEVYDSLFVGADRSCNQTTDDKWAVVHACKHPCHQRAVGYEGNLPQNHREYLVAERDTDLYLNLVDMERMISHEYTEPIVDAALDFIEDNIARRTVLIHCNKGMSRSPALALLYLAARADAIPDPSYRAAKGEFYDRYTRFEPGTGVEAYLQNHWDDLVD